MPKSATRKKPGSKKAGSKKGKYKSKAKKKSRIADTADKYHYYQEAVQFPEEDVKFMKQVYREKFSTEPKIFREDFCGTAWTACTWIQDDPSHVAYGVDLDPEPIQWGLEHNASKLNDEERSRLHLLEGNALESGTTPPADVLAAMNFSFFCFHTRAELLEYFRAVYANIASNGVFVLDMEGGWEAMQDCEEEREEDGFDYIWDQKSFCAITHKADCAIHFEFEDGSRMKDAFQYDWRIWTLPEIHDILEEAGFSDVGVYWEGWDEEEEEGDGNFELTETAENCESWICYVVATKQ